MRTIFEKDLYRYYGNAGENMKQRIFRPVGIKYVKLLRRYDMCQSRLLKILYKLKLWRLSKITGIQILAGTKIGEGFYIGHGGTIIINPRAVIGKNVNIASGVTIGQENRGRREGVPQIGDECWIGANAVIVGNIKIGSDVLIAPLSFVNFDVPSHSIVVGNPAKIINKENATEKYINNKV